MTIGKEAQRVEGALNCLRPGPETPLNPDWISRKRKAYGCDARRRIVTCLVLNQAIIRIGFVKEICERFLLKLMKHFINDLAFCAPGLGSTAHDNLCFLLLISSALSKPVPTASSANQPRCSLAHNCGLKR